MRINLPLSSGPLRAYLLATLAVLSTTVLRAAVPQVISYQGYLTNPGGQAVADDDYTITFSIYNIDEGGSPIWNSGEQTVSVANGQFTYLLGSNEPFTDDFFTDTLRWLGITIGEFGVDPELTPRTRLASVPYTYQALRSDSALHADSSDYADTAWFADSADAITDGAIKLSDIGQNGAATGQVMKWDGTAWAADNDENERVPSGVIVMWSGAIGDIPLGWVLCDGTNGTPNLADRFVKSVPNGSTEPGTTGGSAAHGHGTQTGGHVLTIAEMPAHYHNRQLFPNGSGGAVYPKTTDAWDTYNSINIPTGEAGGNQPHSHPLEVTGSNLPPYYELAFIMKL
jgi:hypothetical protein